MSMTRQHYEKIAKAIRDAHSTVPYMRDHAHQEGAKDMHAYIVHNLSLILSLDNPRFDIDRFVKACVAE